MKRFGVRVKLFDEEMLGYIIRRLNASAYEIHTDDDRTIVLSPEEFKEIDDE